ncbi:MAG: LuxR C-terminal-related transcriptional regulator [Gammaproteobacteria bacterium]
MALVVYTKSESFRQHITNVLSESVSFESHLRPVLPDTDTAVIHLVHAPAFADELTPWLQQSIKAGVMVAVAADLPAVKQMLDCSHYGVQAYINAYMTSANYEQMLRLLRNGQSWYPPQLLAQAMQLARDVLQRQPDEDPLKLLTPREREIALAVADGKSNKVVANMYGISDRTVKTHLTHIFEKLQVKDRVGLVIHMQQAGHSASDYSLMG